MLAIFATLFGSAASLGLGALQIQQRPGDRRPASARPATRVLIGIIAVLTAAFVAVRRLRRRQGHPVALEHQHGAGRRARRFLLRRRPDGLHPQPDPDVDRQLRPGPREMSARTSAEGAATSEWLAGWTVFYWAWWLSWTPFVGMFIARISRGRTIRQFVTGVLLVPSLVSLVWFCIFGGTAIDLQKTGTDIAGAGGVESQLFTVLEAFPLATVASVAGDGAGGDLLRLRCRRRLDRDGHAVRARAPIEPQPAHRHLLGCRDRRVRGRDAARRRRGRAQRAADDHHRGGAAVRRS